MVKKIIITIQARVLSERLKGKIFVNFFNEDIIDRIIRITKKINFKKEIFILSGTKKINQIFLKYAHKHKIKIYFGSELNVLKRFQDFIKINNYKKNFILRITSDNYLIQPQILNNLVRMGVKGNYDYTYIRPLSHYAGELIKCEVLLNEKMANKEVKNHVTIGIRKNKNLKKLALDEFFFGIDHKKYFTLDTISDLYELKMLEFQFPQLRKLDSLECIKKIQKNWKF
jgi:spore coat polysaccharide biosynthesis protein SpsF (cytidylyltransferase family)